MSETAPGTSAPDPGDTGNPAHPGAWERSVTVHGPNYGPVTTGDHSPITVTALGPLPPVADVPPAAGPVGVTGRTAPFVGRSGELADLERALKAGPGAVVQAVHGLGGIGKSMLAARYAVLHAGEYSQVVWISAQDPAGIEAGLARFALALEPHLGVLPSEALAARATAWLASHEGWLLILDNVESVQDIGPLLAEAGSGGRFLATSRRATGWNRIGAAAIRLGALEPDEASALLAAMIGATGEMPDGGAELCTELGFLPLAIAQAGAYIAQNGGGDGNAVRGYLRLLETHPADLYAAGDEDTDATRTIARIWDITLDRLVDTPLAGQVLRVLAWYAPEAIPASLLDALASQPGLGQAVGRLAAYNMLTRNPIDPADPEAGPVLAVHRLVQAVTRTPDAANPHRQPELIEQARDKAAYLLDQIQPEDRHDPGTWPAWRRLLPHIEAFASHAASDTDTYDTVRAFGAGAFLTDQGSTGRGIALLERAASSSRRILGPKHPQTLASRNNLANVYAGIGDLGRAIPLLQSTYEDSRRVLGRSHPETLTALNNLAHAYQEVMRLGWAIALFRSALRGSRRVLGEDDPQTLAIRHNLAGAYETAGRLRQAIRLYEQVLDARRRVLGDDHPDTLTTRLNLASAYDAAGDADQAIPLLQETLDDYRRRLGQDHPESLTCQGNLAAACWSAGDLGRAMPLLQATLDARRRVLGDDHPDTLASRFNLAGGYVTAGDLGRAIQLYEQALVDCRRILGDQHSLTKAVSGELVATMGKASGQEVSRLPSRRR